MSPIILVGPKQRDFACQKVREAPDGYWVTIKEPTRNADQNARMWAMLTDVSKAMPEGRKYTPDQWKAVFMNSCGWECQFLEGLDGLPFPAGFRSSRLTVKQMANLITSIMAYGDQHGVRWSEPHPDERAA